MASLRRLPHELQPIVFQLPKDARELCEMCHTFGTVVYLGIHWRRGGTNVCAEQTYIQ